MNNFITKTCATAIIFSSLFACSNPQDSQSDYESLTFSYDTVHIDAKGELLYLQQKLTRSDLSPDKKHMVNFNFYDHTLEVIDLDRLSLEAKIPFEKEGPHGTGARISHLQYLGKDSLYISNEAEYAFFDFSGKKTASFPSNFEGLGGDEIPTSEKFATPIIFSHKPQQVVGFGRDYANKSLAFLKLDLEGKNLQRQDLPAFVDFKNFHYDAKQPRIIAVPNAQTGLSGSKVILSVDYANDLYVYDMLQETLVHIPNHQKLTPNAKKTLQKQELADLQEFHQTNVMLREQVSFTSPIWDEARDVYYRFSYQEYDFEEEFNPSAKSKYQVFLSILDSDLQLISEHQLPELDKRPTKPFVKDGKIWMMENIDDELAFVRLSMK